MKQADIDSHPRVAEAILNIEHWTKLVSRLEVEFNSLEQSAAAEVVEAQIRARVERKRGRPAKSETVRQLESLRKQLAETRQLLAVEQQALPRIKQKVSKVSDTQQQLDKLAEQYGKSFGQLLEHYRKAVELHRQCFDLNEQYQQLSRMNAGWVTTKEFPSPGPKGGFDTDGRRYYVPSLPEKVDDFLKNADEALYVTSGRKAADDQQRYEEEKRQRDEWQKQMRQEAERHAEHPEVAKKLAVVREAQNDLKNSGVQIRSPDSGAVTTEAIPYWLKLNTAIEDYWRIVAGLADIEFQASWIEWENF